MKRISIIVGRIFYWLSWPAAILYVYGSKRTRLLLMSGDKVLVMKGWINNGQWGIPGGGLHKSEDPVIGLIRELREETGLTIDPKAIKFLGAKPFKDKGFNFECHYFYCELSQKLPAKPHLEVREVTWMNLVDLNEHNATPDVLTAIALVRGA